jgi:hypothetical protein
MPDYWIDSYKYPEDECALCGDTSDLVRFHVRNANHGGRKTITACRSCNSSLRSGTLKPWLRALRDKDHWKWHDILEHQKWERTHLALLVRQIRDEW